MGNNERTAGVVVVRPGDGATGEEACVLFVHLRWTRSGFKSVMHMLNGSDTPKPHAQQRAMGNCTDEELAFFLGFGEGEADGEEHRTSDVTQHVTRLWNSPLVPSSWTREKGAGAVAAARALYPRLSSAAREEMRRREGGGACRRDALSRASLQLPKGAVDPGETPWRAALRELREETGLEESEVCRAVLAPGIRAGPMTAFVVTLRRGEAREGRAAGAGVGDGDPVAGHGSGSGWEVKGSPETVRALWVPVSRVAPGPRCTVLHTRHVLGVLDKVLPNLHEWVPPLARERAPVAAGVGAETG